jgi:hypothetical protein
MAAASVIVFDASRALLLLGDGHVEVEVEVAGERRRPGKGPAHPPFVRLQFLERRPRHRPEHHVVVGQVNRKSVEAVRDHGAGGTARRVVGPEHEMVDEELRAPAEEVRQRGTPLFGLELIGLVDPHPGQLLPPPRQLVASPRVLLFGLEQLEPHGQPLFPRRGLVLRHCPLLLSRLSVLRHDGLVGGRDRD